MSSSQRPLALRFPLYGSRLIEASAGTGKTFTISALYLRLILRHGGDEAFREALLPPQILVVTFTDAATRELRDRIRARLVQAAAVFRGDAEPDELLAELRADFPESEWSSCALRLELAAQWMDEAQSRPFTVGANACCANMHSTAGAYSAKRLKQTTVSCWPRWFVITGGSSAIR